MTLRVAIVDSGIGSQHIAIVSRNFTTAQNDLDHGHGMADLIRHIAPTAALIDARVFGEKLITSAAVVAAAVDWAVAEGAQILNLSFGLVDDRDVLKTAIATAVAQTVLVVAPVPARGGPVYPAAYPGVIRVTGDARCGDGDYSWIGDDRADVGASPRPLQGPDHLGGSSFAAARVSGALAALAQVTGTPTDLLAIFQSQCVIQGRERR